MYYTHIMSIATVIYYTMTYLSIYLYIYIYIYICIIVICHVIYDETQDLVGPPGGASQLAALCAPTP